MILKVVSEKIYRSLMSFIIHKSKLDYRLTAINFNIYLSILLYVGFQVLSTQYLDSDLTTQLVKLVLLGFSARIAIMVLLQVAAFAVRKMFKTVHPYGLKGRVIGVIIRKSENFDFILGVSGGIQILFIGVAFSSENPIVLLPILIILLYAHALIDKYRIMKHSNLLEIKVIQVYIFIV